MFKNKPLKLFQTFSLRLDMTFKKPQVFAQINGSQKSTAAK